MNIIYWALFGFFILALVGNNLNKKEKMQNNKSRVLNFLLVIFAIFFLLLAGDSKLLTRPQAEISTQVAVTPEAKAIKPTEVPKTTPIPTDACNQYADTSEMVPCMQMEDALQQANNPPLQATVTYASNGLFITNNDTVEWDSCDVTIGADSSNINQTYELGGFNNTVAPHTTVRVPWENITKEDGTRFNYFTTQPQDLDVSCTVGKVEEHKKIY